MKRKNTSRIGKREEAQIVKDLERMGYRARRQPGSGNRAVDLQHDIVWHDSPIGKLHIEHKFREQCQWRQLLRYRGGAEILTLRCDPRFNGQDGDVECLIKLKDLLALVGDADERAP